MNNVQDNGYNVMSNFFPYLFMVEPEIYQVP